MPGPCAASSWRSMQRHPHHAPLHHSPGCSHGSPVRVLKRDKYLLFFQRVCRYTRRHQMHAKAGATGPQGGAVERIFFFSGIASTVGGFGMILYQGILFLQSGIWPSYSLFSIIERISGPLGETVAANPSLMNVFQQCPASAVLIVLGLLLLWIASSLRNRFA